MFDQNAIVTPPPTKRIVGTVLCLLDGTEERLPVPAGADRWDLVARAVGKRLNCDAMADQPPVYDAGTRCCSLTVTLIGRRRGRAETLSVPVSW